MSNGSIADLAGKVPPTIQLLLIIISLGFGGGSVLWNQNNEERFSHLNERQALIDERLTANRQKIDSIEERGSQALMESLPAIRAELAAIHASQTEIFAALSTKVSTADRTNMRDNEIFPRIDRVGRDVERLEVLVKSVDEHLRATDDRLTRIEANRRDLYGSELPSPYPGGTPYAPETSPRR